MANILQFSCHQLLKPIYTRLWSGISHAGLPLEMWFGAHIGNLKAKRGVRAATAELGLGSLSGLALEALECFQFMERAELLNLHRAGTLWVPRRQAEIARS